MIEIENTQIHTHRWSLWWCGLIPAYQLSTFEIHAVGVSNCSLMPQYTNVHFVQFIRRKHSIDIVSLVMLAPTLDSIRSSTSPTIYKICTSIYHLNECNVWNLAFEMDMSFLINANEMNIGFGGLIAFFARSFVRRRQPVPPWPSGPKSIMLRNWIRAPPSPACHTFVRKTIFVYCIYFPEYV